MKTKTIKIICTRLSFTIPLTVEQWEKLNAKDDDGNEIHEVASGYESQSVKNLYKGGCFDLEFDGHFGRNFFFSCYTENIKKAKRAVTKFIENL
jgi:hypothetical protein